jgi:hypothetical protein
MLSKFKNTLSFLQPALLLLSITLIFVGLIFSGNSLSSPWSGGTFRALGIWVVVTSIAFMVIRKLYFNYAFILSSISVMLFLLCGVGVVPSAASLLFIASLYTLGYSVSGWIFPTLKNEIPWTQALITGFFCYVGLIGTMIHFPINYPIIYIFLLALPLGLNILSTVKRQHLLATLKNTIVRCNNSLSTISYWQFCCTLGLIGFIGSFAFIPTVMPDDNVYHLGMWSQLTFHHQFLFDIETQLWSAAPFTLDMIHGFLSVISGSDARGSLNIFMLIFLLLSVLQLSSIIFNNAKHTLLTLVLFSSTPMIANLVLGLQTEIILALMTTVGVCCIANNKLTSIQQLVLTFLIFCILVSIKLPAGLIAIALCLCLLVGNWKKAKAINALSRQALLKLVIIFIAGICIALHAYVNAYLITGNPTFPLYNAIFQSPFYHPVNFKDETFTKGATLSAYLGFFFNSSKYFESYNFIAGFQYLLLPLLGALYFLFFQQKKHLLYLAVPIIIFGGVMFSLMQYWRYFFPILPLACVLASALLVPYGSIVSKPHYRNLAIFIFSTYIFLNIHYLPAVSWLLTTNHFKCFSVKGKERYLEQYNIEAVLNQYMNKNHPGENVLFEVTRPIGATLWGKPYYYAWFSQTSLKAFDKMQSKEDLLNFLRERNIHFVYWSNASIDSLPAKFFIRDYIKDTINNYGTKELDIAEMSIYKLDYP